MKLKIFFLSLIFLMGSLNATVVTNSTGFDVELKITYAEKCLVDGYDNENPKYAEFKVLLPNSAKTDVSGNALQNRQKLGCYKDIISLEATINYDDDNSSTKISRIWQNDLSSKPNWLLANDRLKGLILK